MRLKNKKTGEIRELPDGFFCCDNLKKICEEWEDVPEGEYWYIVDDGEVYGFSNYFIGTEVEEAHREIGNLFGTREEAEKAVEKLKAWKRLKDKGFRFVGWDKALRRQEPCKSVVFCDFDDLMESEKDLDLLFGGKE